MSNDKSNLIRFEYVQDADGAPKYVNGVFGGVTPHGEIVAHFYLERPALPSSEVRAIGSDGSLGPEIEKEPAETVWTRQVASGVVLSLGSARAVHAWLGAQIRALEAMAAAVAAPGEAGRQ